ncbi:cytochrome P450 [Streptomyces gardneri]|uniref:cytochrome P450 n=1 Tax=Streptomyces gardneri TaxID=66892 RepID=UPI0035DFBC00
MPAAPFHPVSGPSGLPLLGNLPAFRRDPLAFFAHLRDDFGDVVRWSLGSRRLTLLSHPEHIAELFGGSQEQFRPVDISWVFRQLVGDSVILSQGADWRRKRDLVQPAVRPRQVRGYAATMVDCAMDAARGWADRQRIDVEQEMNLLTQRIVVRTLFGNDLGDRARAVADAMEVAALELGAELRGIGMLLPDWARTPARRRVLAAVETIDAEVGRLIRARQAAECGTGDGADALGMLLAARDEEGNRLTARQVRDEAVTLWGAGHETTSVGLTWCWYLLSAAPEVRDRLTAELDSVLGGRPPTFDDYDRLVWTRQVVKEALRLYPPVWVVVPRITQGGATLGGEPIPDGTTLCCSPWSTHRDPRWFPDPDAFRPERWDADRKDAASEQAWFPFGGGARTCLGARFALVEMALVIATLAQRFHLDIDPGVVGTAPGLQLRPATAMRATLRDRELCLSGN